MVARISCGTISRSSPKYAMLWASGNSVIVLPSRGTISALLGRETRTLLVIADGLENGDFVISKRRSGPVQGAVYWVAMVPQPVCFRRAALALAYCIPRFQQHRLRVLLGEFVSPLAMS